MRNFVKGLFNATKSVAQTPTFKTDMLKIWNITKNGSKGTKVVMGLGASLLAFKAGKFAINKTADMMNIRNKKSEDKIKYDKVEEELDSFFDKGAKI